jgi:predicted amidohydrolase YtcJ
VFAGLFFTVLPARAADPADVISHGGDIVTIDDQNPTAQAAAVEGGKLVAVGKKAAVFKLKGDATTVIGLNGKALVPGFIDAHGHLFALPRWSDTKLAERLPGHVTV